MIFLQARREFLNIKVLNIHVIYDIYIKLIIIITGIYKVLSCRRA